MFTYITLGSNDLARSAKFYDNVLRPLGIKRCVTEDDGFEEMIGWGIYENVGESELALWLASPFNGKAASVGNGTMVALKAKSWNEVNEFHAAALSNGGNSEGEPGLRTDYNPDFYVAYVRDPDGNKLAAVCRGFTAEQS